MRQSGGLIAIVLAASATASAEPQGRLTAHLVGEPAATLAALRVGAADTYAGDGRLTYRPMSELMPDVAAEDPAALLKKADEDLDEGDKAFSGMDIEPAKQRLTAAITAYSAWLPELIARDGNSGKLQTAWVLLAKAYFFDGDAANTRAALRHCMTLDPQLTFKPNVFPPQMKKVVTEVRLNYDVAGLGKLKLDTTPRGAQQSISTASSSRGDAADGRAGERAALRALRSRRPQARRHRGGAHRRRGRRDQQALTPAPARADALFAAVMGRLDEGAPPAELARAAQELGVDLIALGKATPLGGGRVALRGWLYDARRKSILKRAAREAGGSDAELR